MTNLLGAGLTPSTTASTPDERLTAASAPVHDPLWMLSRQFQTGGWVAEDGGTPVSVTMTHATAPVILAGRPVASQLAPVVEAEPLPPVPALDTGSRVRMASELFRLVSDAAASDHDIADLRSALAAAYPLQVRGESGALAAYPGRLPDASTMYAAWRAAVGPAGSTGTLPPVAGLGAGQHSALDAPARAWVAWMSGRVGTGGPSPAPAAWVSEQVSYAFTATATVGGQPVTLSADDYDGAGVSWHSFDRGALAAAPATGAQTLVRPTRLGYPGMPEPGYWTIEDGNVNLDLLASDDPARALLVAFAQAYSNDWFLVPLEVAPGVVLVTSLTVVDTFGSTTEVLPTAAQDGADARFRLWEIGVPAAATGAHEPDAGVGLRVLLPSAPPPLEGRPVEDVVLARDELANLGWLVELTTSDGDGQPVDRYRRWLAARPPLPSGVGSTTGDPALYRLGTTLPDHWYPLEASDVGPDNHRRLRLAALPDGASEVSDAGVRGVTVDHVPGTAVDEEEVSRAGTRVTRVDRLTYTPTGRVVWRARHCDAGTGEATSGLRFDVIEPAG